jgi:hypothetical protein
LIRSDAFIIDVTLNVRTKTLTGLVSSVISLVVAAVLIGPYDMGITGLCIGLLAGRSLLTVIYPALIGRTIEHSLSEQLRSAVRPGVVTVGLFAIAYVASLHASTSSWIVLIVGSAITGIVALGLAYFLGLDPLTRRRVTKRVRVLAGRHGR